MIPTKSLTACKSNIKKSFLKVIALHQSFWFVMWPFPTKLIIAVWDILLIGNLSLKIVAWLDREVLICYVGQVSVSLQPAQSQDAHSDQQSLHHWLLDCNCISRRGGGFGGGGVGGVGGVGTNQIGDGGSNISQVYHISSYLESRATQIPWSGIVSSSGDWHWETCTVCGCFSFGASRVWYCGIKLTLDVLSIDFALHIVDFKRCGIQLAIAEKSTYVSDYIVVICTDVGCVIDSRCGVPWQGESSVAVWLTCQWKLKILTSQRLATKKETCPTGGVAVRGLRNAQLCLSTIISSKRGIKSCHIAVRH